MNRSKRFKQTAVIVMAITVVILLLWRLRARPEEFGGMGARAGTNIFGPATLNLLSGRGPDPEEHPPPAGNSAPLIPITTNLSTATNHPPPPRPSAAPPLLPTNLLNTNGPVTLINVPVADLVETPPGVTAASNVTEASTIEQRLGEASAKGGDIQISLYWNNFNDLDLHCIDPKGEEIWFSHPVSRSAGELDVDRNARPPYTAKPVENIYWPTGKAPAGLYKVFVVYYSPRAGTNPALPTAFTVRTVVRGWQTYFFKSTISFSGRQEPKPVCTLQYDPSNPDPALRFRFVQ